MGQKVAGTCYIKADGQQLVITGGVEAPLAKVKRETIVKALPYKIDKNEDISLDMEVAAKYIAVCAGIPPSSVNQLDLSDLNSLSWTVTGFFMSAASATSPS